MRWYAPSASGSSLHRSWGLTTRDSPPRRAVCWEYKPSGSKSEDLLGSRQPARLDRAESSGLFSDLTEMRSPKYDAKTGRSLRSDFRSQNMFHQLVCNSVTRLRNVKFSNF